MSFLYGVIFGIVLIFGAAFFLIPSESTIPPTPAFSGFVINDTQYNATKYNDVFSIDSQNKTILISTNNTRIILDLNTPTNQTLGGLFTMSCPANQFTSAINNTGHLVCSVLPTPSISSLGGIFSDTCTGNQTMYGISNNGSIMCR